jgi:hypothetical protein
VSSLINRQSLSYLKNSPLYMKLDGSLPSSQQLTTGPYPDIGESSPHHRILKIPSNIILHIRIGLPSALFPSRFPTKTVYTFLISFMRVTCSNCTWWRVQIMRPPSSWYLLSTTSKYTLQHYTLEDPQTIFLQKRQVLQHRIVRITFISKHGAYRSGLEPLGHSMRCV